MRACVCVCSWPWLITHGVFSVFGLLVVYVHVSVHACVCVCMFLALADYTWSVFSVFGFACCVCACERACVRVCVYVLGLG